MAPSVVFNNLVDQFNTLIGTSPIWSAVGFVAAIFVTLYICWKILSVLFGVFGRLRTSLDGRRRQNSQGYGISLAPLGGKKGAATTKALMTALRDHMGQFCFGAPFEVIKAPKFESSGKGGLRERARSWLSTSSTDVVAWGYRPNGKARPFQIDVLSCQGSLSPIEAVESTIEIPENFAKSPELVRVTAAYLFARALQPGLARATAFRAEKLEPVAQVVENCLSQADALSPKTVMTLENDFCAMALHIGEQAYLDRVIMLRRARLLNLDEVDTESKIAARIDLGRALLGVSTTTFDPARVREAMDHLKIAVELLKLNPVLILASQTGAAVQQGQSMLAARRRFSVTGGSGI